MRLAFDKVDVDGKYLLLMYNAYEFSHPEMAFAVLSKNNKVSAVHKLIDFLLNEMVIEIQLLQTT